MLSDNWQCNIEQSCSTTWRTVGSNSSMTSRERGCKDRYNCWSQLHSCSSIYIHIYIPGFHYLQVFATNAQTNRSAPWQDCGDIFVEKFFGWNHEYRWIDIVFEAWWFTNMLIYTYCKYIYIYYDICTVLYMYMFTFRSCQNRLFEGAFCPSAQENQSCSKGWSKGWWIGCRIPSLEMRTCSTWSFWVQWVPYGIFLEIWESQWRV